jgi:hypothetical protein
VKIVEDHFRDRFSAGDRARDSDTTGEDETEYERVDTTGNPPTDSLDNRSKMGISHPNEHRFLPLAAPAMRRLWAESADDRPDLSRMPVVGLNLLIDDAI